MAGGLPSGTAGELRKAADEMSERAKVTLKQAAEEGADSSLALEAHKQQVLRDTLKSAGGGKPGRTQKTLEYVRKLEQQAADEAGATTKNVTTLEQIGKRLKEGDLPSTAPATPAARRALPPSGGQRATAAEDAFQRRNYKLARQRYEAALELEIDLSPEEIARIQERIQLINQYEKVAREYATRAATATNRAVTVPFEETELTYLTSVPFDKMRKLKNSVGGDSFTNPRIIYSADGRPIAVFKPASLEGAQDLEGEIAAYEFGKLLGIEVPAATRIKVTGPNGEEIEGVAVRFVQGSDFIKASEAEFLFAKRDIARDKAFSVFIGDHDRHMGNYFRTPDGRVLSIDHGMADLAEAHAQGAAPAKFESLIKERMEFRTTAVGEVHGQIGNLERDIVFQDMGDVVAKIENLTDDQMNSVLRKVYGEGPAAESKIAAALSALKIRQRELRSTMQEHFRSLPNPIKTISLLPRAGRPIALLQLRPALRLAA